MTIITLDNIIETKFQNILKNNVKIDLVKKEIKFNIVNNNVRIFEYPVSYIDAQKIQGIPVSSVKPQNNQVLVYNSSINQWIPSNIDFPGSSGNYIGKKLILTQQDIQNGYKIIDTNPSFSGERKDVELIPYGGILQDYGIDFTAMNDDGNENLYLIWKTSGIIPGISSPTYPTVGIQDFEEGDILQVFYLKEEEKEIENSKNLIREYQAGENLSGHRIVMLNNNKLYYADCSNENHIFKILGITTMASNINEYNKVKIQGEIEEIGWNWDLNKLIFLGNLGYPVQTKTPNAKFLLQIGYPITNKKIFIDIKTPIKVI